MEVKCLKFVRRWVALLLCAAMMLSIMPVRARAETDGTEQTTQTEEAVSAAVTDATDPTEETEATDPTEETEALIGTLAVTKGLKMGQVTLPEYETASGAVSQVLEYDCGNGVANDGSKSYLVMITGTTAEEFAGYCAALSDTYTLNYENTTDGKNGQKNLFCKYVAADKSHSVYTYFLEGYGETRIIVDTQADTVAGYSYVPQADVSVEPKLVLWGLSMSPNGYDISGEAGSTTGRRNCGAMVVIRMPDNSLFIHDSGDVQQWSDAACAEFLDFCRELTGISEGKMVINTWFLSHAHSDHFQGFTRFMLKYHDHFELENIVYNIDIERSNTDLDIHHVMQRVSGYYDHVNYYKPHTGETLNIAGVKVDVMYTHEDRLYPN